jgi:DNA transformation protein
MPSDQHLREWTALRNVGPAIARRLVVLGFTTPAQLRGRPPHELFAQLSDRAGHLEDPCLLYTLQAVIDQVNGGPSRPWWEYAPRARSAVAAGDAPSAPTPRQREL